jgi:hypothetical protein
MVLTALNNSCAFVLATYPAVYTVLSVSKLINPNRVVGSLICVFRISSFVNWTVLFHESYDTGWSLCAQSEVDVSNKTEISAALVKHVVVLVVELVDVVEHFGTRHTIGQS